MVVAGTQVTESAVSDSAYSAPYCLVSVLENVVTVKVQEIPTRKSIKTSFCFLFSFLFISFDFLFHFCIPIVFFPPRPYDEISPKISRVVNYVCFYLVCLTALLKERINSLA